MVLPRPRGHLITEQRNPRSSELDRLSVREILELINAEDATIAAAVKGAIPRIERFVERVAKAIADYETDRPGTILMDKARAAIKAMKDLTPEMSTALLYYGWHAAIDAALEEPEE